MALTPDENEELRRIHVLAQFGELPESMQARYDELRAGDEHLEIAEPTLDVTWLPVQRTRENSLDDAIDALLSITEDIDEAFEDELAGVDTSHLSIADLAQLEAAVSGNDFYVATPYTGGFAPSSWYRKS